MALKTTYRVRVEYYWKGAADAPQVMYWQILPEHIANNINADAQRCEIVIKGYKTTLADLPQDRVLYHECDGSKSLTEQGL